MYIYFSMEASYTAWEWPSRSGHKRLWSSGRDINTRYGSILEDCIVPSSALDMATTSLEALAGEVQIIRPRTM
jgi:hypothetical protein